MSKLKSSLLAIAFIGILATVAHLLFSSFGFVPTDDGFMLAYSRRILDGQIPYRDFLSAHNIGTPLLFVPFVYWGGDYTFWITRLIVWIEFASIVCIWTSLLIKYSAIKNISLGERMIIAIIAFFFTAHSFPIMVWYTIDGIFIYSLGLAFLNLESRFAKGIGYFLVGSVFLIKQNFIFLLPATVLLLGDWRSKRTWFLVFLPSLLYYMFFLFTGALHETLLQTTSRKEFMQTAVKAYWGKFTVPWGIICGFIGSYLLYINNKVKKICGFLLLLIPIIYSAFYLKSGSKFVWDASFLLFGSILGGILFFLWKGLRRKNLRIITLGLICAWTVGISGGYNNPALASGILFVSSIAIILTLIQNTSSVKLFLRYFLLVVIIILLLTTAKNFYYTRTHNIYGESRPANELTYKADKVLAGGKNLLVSKKVYSELLDLQTAISIAQEDHMPYAILSHYAGLWVKSEQENPLLMDFPFIFNSQKTLIEPLTRDIKQKRGTIIIIINKNYLQQKQLLSGDDVFQVALEVPQYYKKIGETKYFVLYK